jgi:hypothetical protein
VGMVNEKAKENKKIILLLPCCGLEREVLN